MNGDDGTWWIVMTINISGGRADGRAWPPANSYAIDLPAAEAAPLVRAGNARRVAPPEDVPAPVLAPEAPAVPHEAAPGPVPSVVSQPAATAAGPVAAAPDPAPVTAEAPDPGGPAEPPRPADPKAAWVEHAVTQGASRPDAEAATKADLMSTYGGRL